ncbi:MAG: hypothetical protein F6K19_49620 [Cyanothece sp. SIO1E1]|nr:hypothetical protein [Cyanothece sp. SIO1E1]
MSSYFIRPDNDSFSALGIDANVEVTTIEDIPPSQWSDIEDGSFVAIPFNQFLPLSKAQSMFAQLSSANDRAQNSFLSRAIEPNTLYLEEISEERWKNSRIPGANEVIFNLGDVIVREGETITPIIKEALDIMVVSLRFERLKDSVKIELAKEPRSPPESSANGAENNSQQETPASKPTPEPESRSQERERPQGKLPPLLSPTTVAQNESATSAEVNQTSNNLRKNGSSELAASSSLDTPSVMSSFTRWMIGLLLLIVVCTLVFLHFRKGPPVYVPAENPPALIEDRKQNLMKALASQLTQTLFKQRQELLKSKEEATAQVAAMEDRLAKLQPEIFDKLAAYEKKIKELEAQLEQRGVSKEMMNQGLEAGFARPIFDDATDSVEGEENLETEAFFPADNAEDDKEVPFPGHVVADDLDEDGPSELLEEVLEDLEAESGFEQRIAKGSDR